MSGLDAYYTSIVTQLTYMLDISTALLTFESRVEQLNVLQNLSIDGTITANTVQSQKNAKNTIGNWRGNTRGRNRGRGKQQNSRLVCQICGKTGHLASVCYYRTDFSYMGNVHESNNSITNQANPYIAYVSTPETVADQNWCMYNGASHHVTNDASQLHQMNKYHRKTKLIVGDGKSLPQYTISVLLLSNPIITDLFYLIMPYAHLKFPKIL